MATRIRSPLAECREKVGHTQESLAEELGVERTAVGRWERGTQQPRPWLRHALAATLGLSREQLNDVLRRTARPSVSPDGTADTSPQAAIPMLRQLLDVYDLPSDGPVPPLSILRQQTSALVRHRLNSRYTRIGQALPGTLPALTRALYTCRDGDRTEIASLLVQAYRAADAIADKLGFPDLSARIIGVMQWAAAQAEDPITTATVAYVRAETFFTSSQFGACHRMLEQAAEMLRAPGASAPSSAAVYGALHMRAAVAAARAELLGHAQDHLHEARDMAARLNEGVYAGTAFGHDSLRVHQVTLALDAADPGGALAAAAGWEPPVTLPAERRSHFYIDLGRSHFLAGSADSAFDALGRALLIAPEHVRAHPRVRELVSTSVRRGGTSAARAEMFREKAGIPAETAAATARAVRIAR